MQERPFRFLHAADLHLERPPHGLADVPDHWRQRLLDAPYEAARAVVDAAIAEHVDFLLLSGDVLDPDATGPRGPLFLLEQFNRLAAAGIAVYWVGGRVDPPGAWPAALRLPVNVRLFNSSMPEAVVHERADQFLCRIIGWSRPRRRKVRTADFHADASGLFTIALVYLPQGAEFPSEAGIDYWALGGVHQSGNVETSPGIAHWPGTPQGRSFTEPRQHGCTLVQVDRHDQPHLSLVTTDVLRWQQCRVQVEPDTSATDLQRQLMQKMDELLSHSGKTNLLVEWTIVGTGPLLGRLRRGSLATEMLEKLRLEYGDRRPGAWSTSLVVQAEEVLGAARYQEDTLLGDYLRTLRSFETPPTKGNDPLDLTSLLGAHADDELLAAAATLHDVQTRERVLREAAAMGVDLLSGEERST